MLTLYFPGKEFLSISVTGPECELGCAHCDARFLRHMTPALSPEALYEIALEADNDGCVGMLVSGGSDKQGIVPIFKYLNIIKKIKNNTDLVINLHTGFIEAGDVAKLENVGIDIISFDIVGSEAAARNVYGLDLTPDYFGRTLTAFKSSGLNVVPHVTAGLDGGRNSGEEEAMNIIARHPPGMVIVNSLMPEPGQTPEGQRLEATLELASRILPKTVKIGVGCMRPRNMEIPVERLAELGIFSIAAPTPRFIKMLEENEIPYVSKNGCCSLESLKGRPGSS